MKGESQKYQACSANLNNQHIQYCGDEVHTVVNFRMWFWLKEQTGDQSSHFEFTRDNIYGATILMGIGTIMCWVVAAFLIAELVGQSEVSFTMSFSYDNVC